MKKCKIESQDWVTLEDFLMRVFKEKKTSEPDMKKIFDALVRVYGREKLEKVWKKYKDEK